MSTKRRPNKRRSTARVSQRGKTRPKAKKRSPPKRKKSVKKTPAKKRSQAAKKGWAKRRKKQRLIDAMHDMNWREIAMPTRDELYDYMEWMSQTLEIDISDMYRLYYGYDVGGGEAAE